MTQSTYGLDHLHRHYARRAVAGTDQQRVHRAVLERHVTRVRLAGREPDRAQSPDRPEFYGEVLRVEPPQVLSYTFHSTENEAAGHPPTRVLFEARPFGDVVILTVTHDEFPTGEAGDRFRRGISQGWPAILSSLKTLLESGAPLPYPAPFGPKRPVSA